MDEKQIEKKFNECLLRFEKIGGRWKELRKDTGVFLLESQSELSKPFFKALQSRINTLYGISDSEQKVCMLVAADKVHPDLPNILAASTINRIDISKMPEPDKDYTIISPDNGKVVVKKLRDFTRNEIKANVGSDGVSYACNLKPEETPVMSHRASEHRFENGNLVLFVRAKNMNVTYPITAGLVEEMQSALHA